MLPMDAASKIIKSEAETLRSELQKKAFSHVLDALINIFSYLETRKSVDDTDQQYRQNDFIILIYSIGFDKISTYCELEDYLYKPARVSALSQGKNSTDYLDLSMELYHAIIHATDDFSALSHVVHDFIESLRRLAKSSFASQLLTRHEMTITNLLKRTKTPTTSLNSQQLFVEIERLNIATFNTLYSITTDATIRTLLIAALYVKQLASLSDSLKERALLRLKKTSIASLSELQPAHRPYFSNILFRFGQKLAANHEVGYQVGNRDELLQQALGTSSEAERIVLLAAIQELDKNRFFSANRLEPSPTEMLTWHHEGDYAAAIHDVKLHFLSNEWRRCLYVDLELIKQYLSYYVNDNGADQMFRRRDFFKIICYINYGLIDSIQSLVTFLHDPERRRRLTMGYQSSRYDTLTETFLARARACNNILDIKNSCAAIIDYYDIEHTDTFLGLCQNNKLQLTTLTNIRDFTKDHAIFNKSMFEKIEQIYEYLVDNHQADDINQKFRRFDFMKILRLVVSSTISSRNELSHYLDKTERINFLTNGFQTKTYHELVSKIINMITNTNWTDFKGVCEKFITYLKAHPTNQFNRQLLAINPHAEFIYPSLIARFTLLAGANLFTLSPNSNLTNKEEGFIRAGLGLRQTVES